MACAVLDFEPAIMHDVEYDDVQQIATDAALYTPEAFEADSKRALEFESVEHVEALLAFAFATPAQTYDLVARTVAGFISQDMRRKDYAATFSAAALAPLVRVSAFRFSFIASDDQSSPRP